MSVPRTSYTNGQYNFGTGEAAIRAAYDDRFSSMQNALKSGENWTVYDPMTGQEFAQPSYAQFKASVLNGSEPITSIGAGGNVINNMAATDEGGGWEDINMAYVIPALVAGGVGAWAAGGAGGALGDLAATDLAGTGGTASMGGVGTTGAVGSTAGGAGVDDIFDIFSDSGQWNGFDPATGTGTGGTFGGLEDLAAQYPDQFGDLASQAAANNALTPMEQLKYMYDKLPSLPPGTQTAVKELLAKAATAMGATGLGDASSSGFLGKIGDWFSNNPGTALLGGGVLAAILADRNKQQTLTQTTTQTPEGLAATNTALGALNNNTFTPSGTYAGPLSAGLDPNQVMAAENARTGPTAGALQKYMDPYLEDVLKPQVRNFNIDTATGLNSLDADAFQKNAFGSGRADLAKGMYSEGRDRTLQGSIIAPAFSTAFNNATNMYNTNQNTLSATGAVGQATQQSAYDKLYQDWLNAEKSRQFASTVPVANAGAVSSLNKPTTTVSTGSPPSLMSQLAGAGTALYGASQLMKP